MIEWINPLPELNIAHIGPPLDAGPLPSVFYFALSAEQSLGRDPFNQPALLLSHKRIRVFSLNLPSHGPGLSALDAMGAWAQNLAEGHDLLSPFFDLATSAIQATIDEGLADREKIGVMGLSRGGWIGLHTMARSPLIHSCVCFAPLIDLSQTLEFQRLGSPSAPSMQIPFDPLINRAIHLYISNRDTRVGTRHVINFVERLVETSFAQGVRSPPVELTLTPPIGHMGHGTSQETFILGASWLAKRLGQL